MEIVALLLAWAFALTFVAWTGKSKQKAPKPVAVRVPAQLPQSRLHRQAVLRRMNRRR